MAGVNGNCASVERNFAVGIVVEIPQWRWELEGRRGIVTDSPVQGWKMRLRQPPKI